jgi:glycosyltransferase involved in cell wall biosynthesis
MSRILLLGYNPPGLEPNRKVDAANYRTWQFLQPLLEDGHTICFCANQFTNNQEISLPDDWDKKVLYRPIPFNQFGWKKMLQQEHDRFNPDCIVAVNFDMCLCATSLKTEEPIWMDIYGDYMTIVQAACFRSQSDRGIPTSISFVKEVLRKGDVFSSCSIPQDHALIGELALAGRLNFKTFGYQFTNVIRPGAFGQQNNNQAGHEKRTSKINGIEEDDFIVLWCGGYNTWTDVDTLFTGFELAMSMNPKIKFISIGANTYNTPDNVYDCFLKKIEHSPHRENYIMMGWLPWEEIPSYYKWSNAGINIDAMHYETIYGTRTRLIEMIAAGLPVITSLGTELSYLLKNDGVALTFEVGNWQGLSEAILHLANNPEINKAMGIAARNYAFNQLSFLNTTLPLKEWVKKPEHAPDKLGLSFQSQFKEIEYLARSKVRLILWKLLGFAH